MMRMKLGVTAAIVGAVLAFPGVSGAAPRTQDSVLLTGGPGHAGPGNFFTIFTINATSGPSGEDPTGQVDFRVIPFNFAIAGPVSCLAVRGNTATINFSDQTFGIDTVQVADNQPDTFDAAPTGRASTDCSPLPPSGSGGPLSGADITVVDAPSLPTAKNQCQNGGWRRFGFKNQGRCIRSVKHGPM